MNRFACHPPSAIRHPRSRRGFTLIEAALATVIVGVGVLAIVAAQQAYHMKNGWAQHTDTAMSLANELRELTLTLPMHDSLAGTSELGPGANEYTDGKPDATKFDDLDDFAGVVTDGHGAGMTIWPPINALRQTLTDMKQWRQVITVGNVLPDNISATFTQPLGTTDMMRVTVQVDYKGPYDQDWTAVTQLNWVAANQ